MLDKQGNWETAEFKKTESIKEIQKQTLLHIKNAAGIKQYKKPHKNQKEEGKKKTIDVDQRATAENVTLLLWRSWLLKQQVMYSKCDPLLEIQKF